MINTRRMYVANMLLGILPNSGCQRLKTCLWRWAGVKVGRNVEIFQGAKIHGIGEVEIGNNVFIGHDTLLMVNIEDGVVGRIILDDYCALSSRVMVITGSHHLEPQSYRVLGKGISTTVHIERGVGVFAGSIILPNVTLGQMSVIAAGAVVSKDVEQYTMVGGCPAKFIKRIEK